MKHTQVRIEYYPKKEGRYEWQSTPVDIFGFIDFTATESIEKKQDAAQLPFLQRTFINAYATYSSITDTFTVSGNLGIVDNKYRWFTIVDKNYNRYIILSHTVSSGNTVFTLSTEYRTGIPTPVTGAISIQLPDFKMDDEFDFLAWNITDGTYNEPANLADKLVFLGQVMAINNKYSTNGTQITLKIGNMSELLLKDVDVIKYMINGATNKWYLIFQNILDEINYKNKNMIILEWDWYLGSGTPLKQDGVTAFPDIGYTKDATSAMDALVELCQNQYTADGEYYFYIKPCFDGITRRKFKVYVAPKLNVSTSDLTEGTDFILDSRTVDKADIVSFIIMRCGLDPDQDRITCFKPGDLSKGFKTQLVTENFASQIMTDEITNNPSDFDTTTNGLYPLTYNYTTFTEVTAEEVANSSKKLDAGAQTITSDGDYKMFIRYLSRARGLIYANQLLSESNNAREKITINFLNQPMEAVPGNVSTLKIPSIGWTGGFSGQHDYRKRLRAQSKTLNVTKNGLEITVDYLEDWTNLTGGLI